jgi:peptidyl-prolyl cis-trans isomerase D
VLLIIVVGFALLAFILGDLLTSGSTFMGKARDRAFVVNGEVITTQQYADKITQFEDFQKMVSGQSSLDENITSQIREAVFQQMVRERLLGIQAKKLGLVVSKAEMNDLVHGEFISPILQQLPFFIDHETGFFSRAALVEFLNVVNTTSPNPQEQAMVDQYKTLWLFIEDMVKTQRLEEKYISLLSNAVAVNDVEAKAHFDLSRQNADIVYAVKNYFTVADSLAVVTDKEVKDFYDQHKEMYRLDAPLVKLTYFMKEIVPSDEDFAEVEEESRVAYDQLAEAVNPAVVVADYSDVPYRDVFMSEQMFTPSQLDFVRTAAINDMYGPAREEDTYQVYKLIDKAVAPDSVRLSLIAIPDASMVGQDTLVAHFVDSLYNVLRKGEPFANVANSLNPSSNGGEVGWAREIDLISLGAESIRSIFSASVGEPLKLSMPGQQLIVQVEEKTRPTTKYKLAVVNMPVVPSEKTSNNVDNQLNQLVSADNIGANFTELASEGGYMVMPNMTYSANDFSLGQIPNSRQVITWAANESKMGSVKKFDLTNARIVARVDQVIPAGYSPLSEVSDGIRVQLVNDKKAQQIIENLENLEFTSLDGYAAAMNSAMDTVRFVNFTTRNITGIGVEPVLSGISAFAPENVITGPVKGNMGVYVASVVNRVQDQEEVTYDAREQKSNMMGNNAYRMQMQSIEVLKNILAVEDNRYRFF